jgi:hypothetical protein
MISIVSGGFFLRTGIRRAAVVYRAAISLNLNIQSMKKILALIFVIAYLFTKNKKLRLESANDDLHEK